MRVYVFAYFSFGLFFFNNFARNTNLARRGYFTLRTENEKKEQ